MNKFACRAVVLLGVNGWSTGCAWMPGDDGGGPDGRPGVDDFPSASGFSCDDLDTEVTLCMDFNDGMDGVQWEDGDWRALGGRLVGYGPEATQGECPESLMSHAVVDGARAQNLRVRAELASVERVDKVLVLRSTSERDRVQLNFRALSDDDDYGDLVVQEIRDCEFTIYTPVGTLPLSHDLGDRIDVDVELVGTYISVTVDDRLIVDREFPIAVRSGDVGFGVIDHATTLFDDLIIESLD